MLGEAQNSAMQDYISRYSSRLNELLNYAQQTNLGSGAGPQMPPSLEASPAGAAPNLGATPSAAAPTEAPAQQQPQQAPLQKNAEGKVIIQSRPENFDFGVAEKDLSDVKTVGDLVQKMPEQKADEYMNWWEQRYGQINDKYDAMLAELGQRPDPNSRDLSRKDKFTMLMEFGLNLMRHSRQGGDRTAAVGGALHDTVRGDQARREKDFERHRSLTSEIEARRQQDLKAVGTQGDAMVTSQNLGSAVAKEQRAQQEFNERDDEIKNVIYGDEAVVGVNRRGKATTITDESGKPVKSTLGVARGPRGGTSGRGGYAPSDPEKRSRFYSEVYGIPLDVATDVVRQEKTGGDPYKAYTRIVDRLTAQYYPQDEAIKIARQIIEGGYGPGALDDGPAPAMSDPAGRPGARNLGGTASPSSSGLSDAPPASKLKAGRVTTVRNPRTGEPEKWTLDETGQAKRVLR